MIVLGRMLSLTGAAGFAIALFWGLALCVAIVYQASGIMAALASVLLAPLTFAVVPWVSGLAMDSWLPLFLNYGAGMLALPLILAGKALAGDFHDRAQRRTQLVLSRSSR
jgi:hypothetical protein